jgi:nucleotide-binding universal stress UspA family protein
MTVMPDDDHRLRTAIQVLDHAIWPDLTYEKAVKAVRFGPVVDTIRYEVLSWKADLLVVGSHGKGWIDRLLLGSVTHRLLNELPASLVVVPTAGMAETLQPATVEGASWMA